MYHIQLKYNKNISKDNIYESNNKVMIKIKNKLISVLKFNSMFNK